jgi:L-fuculose-phosphate aldolase
MLEPQRERVATAARRLAGEGLVFGTAGNISERAGDRIAITPTGAVLQTLTAGEVVVIDADGRQLDGRGRPTSELALHLGVYRRFEAGAVVHAHPPVSTALACVLDELPAVHYSMVALGGPVRVARYATFGTDELAENTLEALAGRSAALMANHGTITHGEDLSAALERSLLLEWAATVYWRAASIGQPRALDHDQLQEVQRQLDQRNYAWLAGAHRHRL